MARLSADNAIFDSLAIRHIKRLVPRFMLFAILSVLAVYVVTDYTVQDELFLGFVIVFTTMLMIGTMILELIAWLYSWLWNQLINSNE